jgi:EmrB/QacA subfamily drug resistance transporter
MTGYISGNSKTDRKILFSIAFAAFMVNLDTYIVNISLPEIARNFNIGQSELVWIALSYQLTVAGLLLVYGRLGDLFGLKKIFLFGFLIFTIGSLFCGLSNNLTLLIISRSIQGIGASVLYALTPAMVPRFLPAEIRGQAFGVLATVAALGIILGAPVGGLITAYLSWHWIFIINVPVGIAAIWSAKRILPDDSTTGSFEQNKFDYSGAILSFSGILLMIYALNQGHRFGWTSTITFILIIASLFLFFILFMYEHKTKYPLFDLDLFKNKYLSFGYISSLLACMYLAGNNFLIPFYLQYVLKLKTEETGLVFLAYPLVYMFISPIAGKLSNKFHPGNLCTFGMILGSVTSLTFAFVSVYGSLLFMILYFVFLAFTFGTFFPSNNNFVMGKAPAGKQGIVSGMFRLTGMLGMIIGVCVFEVFFTGVISPSENHGINNINLLPIDVLIKGFRYLYIFGSVLLLFAAVFSFLTGTKKRPDD